MRAVLGIDWNKLSNKQLSASDSLAIVTHLKGTADRFVRVWRYAWELSESGRNGNVLLWPEPTGSGGLYAALAATRGPDGLSTSRPLIISNEWRHTLLHCHPEGGFGLGSVEAHIIRSGVGKRAMCPSWYPNGFIPPFDERRNIDNSILPALRPLVASARDRVLRELAEGARLLPQDSWIVGQRVRFAVDRSDANEVRLALEGCRAPGWWCAALEGYARHQFNDASADLSFEKMLTAMPAAVRCEWVDLTPLLHPEDQRGYSAIPCEQRDSVNRNIWWLADAEYSDAVNIRRAEHFSRRVLIAVRGATSFHERWDMTHTGGGRAIAEMLVRYGWPEYSHWQGMSTDRAHYNYLAAGRTDHGRFTTAEYAAPRFRMIPRAHAIGNPTEAWDSDWEVSHLAHDELNGKSDLWWPNEHYMRDFGPVVQLWNQHGLFRRHDSVLFVLATIPPAEHFPGSQRDTLHGALFTGTAPSSMRAQSRSAAVGSIGIIKSFVSSQPQLLSLELNGPRQRPVMARARFGIQPPPPLSALLPGEIAIAPPVLLQQKSPEEPLPNDPESAFSRMYPGTELANPQVIGLYWETYGFAARDSVELTLRVEKIEGGSIFSRFASALGLARRGTASVAWSETQPRQSMIIVSGPVPIQGRVVALSMSQLPAGDYTMIVSAARPSGAVVSATRAFSLRR